MALIELEIMMAAETATDAAVLPVQEPQLTHPVPFQERNRLQSPATTEALDRNLPLRLEEITAIRIEL